MIRIWNNIPQAFDNTLIRSMRRRCQATDFVNVQKTLDPMKLSEVKCYSCNCLMKMHYSTIYCTL